MLHQFNVEHLFRWFKDGDFVLNVKESLVQANKFKDAELDALLDADQCQMINDHLEKFEIHGSCSKAKKFSTIRIETKRHWKAFFAHANCCKKEICFFMVSSLEMPKGYITIIPTQKMIVQACPIIHINSKAEYPSFKGDVQKGLSFRSYIPGQTITDDPYRQQLVQLNRDLKAKQMKFTRRHDNVISQHFDNSSYVSRTVRVRLEILRWYVLPQTLYYPDLFRIITCFHPCRINFLIALKLLWRFLKMARFMDCRNWWVVLSPMNPFFFARKMGTLCS